MPIQTALLGVLPPVAIAVIVLLVTWRPWTAQAGVTRIGIAGSAFALALAYAVTDSLLSRSGPGLPPTDLHRWLPWLGAAAAIAAALVPPTEQWRLGTHNLVALLTFMVMKFEYFRSKDTILAGLLWVVLTTMIAGSMRTDAIRVGRCGPRVPLVWMIACVGAAVTFVQSGFSFLAQMAGACAAVMAVFALFAFWRPRLEFVRGMAPVFAVLFVAMTQAGSSYVSLWSKVLLMLAGLSPALAETPLLARGRPWLATVLCMLLAGALCTAAVWQSPGGFDFGGY
jgi:hypothetical protein